jgi:hypothetical protein
MVQSGPYFLDTLLPPAAGGRKKRVKSERTLPKIINRLSNLPKGDLNDLFGLGRSPASGEDHGQE